MKKIKKIIAGSLMALSISNGSHVKGINKNAVIGSIGAVGAVATILLGRSGIQNGTFLNSNSNLFYKKYSDSEAEKCENEILENNKNISRINLNDQNAKMNLSGFIYKPNGINEKNIKKVILVFGGNSELACKSLKYAVDRDEVNKKDAIFISFDYPTYRNSKGPKLSEKVMEKYADLIYQYAIQKYCNADIFSYGYCLGGYASSHLGKYEKVKILKCWSPVNFKAAVNGLTGFKWLGDLACYWGFEGQKFNSIKNIKESHENCKVYLFSGSCQNGDFLSLEMSVLDGK